MRKILLLLCLYSALRTPHSALAQDYTYSTNLFYALTYPTNIYVGTNGTDPGGDNFHTWATKINHFFNLGSQWQASDSNSLAATTTGLLTVSNALYNFFLTNGPGGGSYPDIADSGGVVSIAGAFNSDSGGIYSDGSGDLTAAWNFDCYQLVANGSITSDGGNFFSDGSGDVTVTTITGLHGWFATDGSGNVTMNSVISDGDLFYSDGSGNVTAQTFNPVSDRTKKEQITPLAPAKALAMALGLTNYSWRFKAHTNWAVVKAPISISTNFVRHTLTNRAGTVLTLTNFMILTNGFILATNSGKVFAASGLEIGPMAQDWNAVTGLGTGTNISVTSEAGLLLGAVQGLAAQQGVFSNPAGARFRLLVNAQTNGFIFVPSP